MAGPYRSLAFVPGNNGRFLAKSRAMRADIVCLDLEDSVPPDRKAEARAMVREELGSEHAGRVFVRTNPPRSGLVGEDMAALGPGIDGIVVPKVSDGAELDGVIDLLAEAEARLGLPPLEVIP